MNAEFTRRLALVVNTYGKRYAKQWAKDKGYVVRWDRDGNLYIRDLGAEK